jgi:hypothetical protein
MHRPVFSRSREKATNLASAAMSYDRLYSFRQRAHQYLGRAHDAAFELMDAVMTTRHVYSFPELSQSPLFRRQWPSLYEALEDSRPQRKRLMQLYIEQIPTDRLIVLAGDHTGWFRSYAERLRERTHEHQVNGGDSRGPVTVGQGYSTLAWIPEDQGSWALPLRRTFRRLGERSCNFISIVFSSQQLTMRH